MSHNRMSCSCCSKIDVDTKKDRSVLHPGGYIYICSICESMLANPMNDILFFMDKMDNKISEVSSAIDLVFYNTKTDRYIDYKTMRSLDIETKDGIYLTRKEVINFIKSGGVYHHGDVSYNEVNKIILTLKHNHKLFLSFLHRTTDEWDVALTFDRNEDAISYMLQAEDIDEEMWEPITSDITVLGTKVPSV